MERWRSGERLDVIYFFLSFSFVFFARSGFLSHYHLHHLYTIFRYLFSSSTHYTIYCNLELLDTISHLSYPSLYLTGIFDTCQLSTETFFFSFVNCEMSNLYGFLFGSHHEFELQLGREHHSIICAIKNLMCLADFLSA